MPVRVKKTRQNKNPKPGSDSIRTEGLGNNRETALQSVGAKGKRMDAMERRIFLKGASMGVLAFTLGGAEILMTPKEARARAVPFRLLGGQEAETLEALGEALV